ncbi:MAG TPA: FCD domain-containing protein [Conexibacter sp.]|nr:FCD domain-containing protein [Conexibacter sp.]
MTEQVAHELLRHLQEERLQVGARLGREQDLARAYGVSRPTMREALGLLANAGLLRASRGPGGGISVARTVEAGIGHAVAQSISAMLDVEAVTIGTLVDARALLEPAIARLAAERLDGATAAELAKEMDETERHADEPTVVQPSDARFHRLIARAAGNPMLQAVVDWAFEVLQPRVYELSPPLTGAKLVPQHRAILDALVAHDPDAAAAAMRAHVEHVRAVVAGAGRRAGGRVAPAERAEHGGAERTARDLRAYVQGTGLEPGDRIGRADELAVRFGVSRPVLREALRLLASAKLVRIGRGPGGGVFVANTFGDALGESVSDAVVLLLETGAVTVEVLHEARTTIEVPLAGLAAAHTSGTLVGRLRRTLENPGAGGANAGFHRAIAAAAKNPVLLGVSDWIWSAQQPAYDALVGPPGGARTLARGHAAILAAIEDGDVAGAEAAMRAHLLSMRRLVDRARRRAPRERASVRNDFSTRAGPRLPE